LGFTKFRGTRADEVGFALAFSEHRIEPFDDENGESMRTPIGISGPMHIDVLDGYCRFVKGDRHVAPSIVHFSTWHDHPIYQRECAKLRLYFGRRLTRPLARLGGAAVYWRRRLRWKEPLGSD
jgi:hypothetical protein